MSQDVRQAEEATTQRRANVLGLSYADTSSAEKVIYKDLLSTSELYSLRAIPLSADQSHVHFGITTTTSQQTMNNLRQRFMDQRVDFSIISDTGYSEYMRLYDPPRKVVYQDMALTGGPENMIEGISATLEQVRSDDMLAYIVQQAYRLKASDIHLECQKQNVRIRLRVDGVLHPVAFVSHEKYHQLMSSIAVSANISTGSPDAQTGHINKNYKMANSEEVTLNLRIETVPTVYGIDVVMRLFNLKLDFFKLENLGLSSSEMSEVEDVIKHPTGMVLVVGPTGSGKTTTLYSLINTLNTDENKIITLEDPVEYYMPGVVQIPVQGDQDAKGFAEKLRAVLRLDPDIVMVGEIRDQDTARTALQAALTGHLVLSTFHASSAAAALTRMLDSIGVNPLFSSAMHLVMAQRLVRRLDDNSKQAYEPDSALKAQLQEVIDTFPPGLDRPDISRAVLYKPGISADNPFGYAGQIALREQLKMTPGVQQLLRLPPTQLTTEALQAKAVEEGMMTMLQDGLLKALAGQTTLEEVYRVVGA